MKKIVALVLAMVMVLGLATVASAATTNVVGDYQVVQTVDTAAVKHTVTAFTKTTAVAPVDGDADGVWDEAGVDVTGQVEHYTFTVNGSEVKVVPVASAADADWVLYVKDAKTPYMYLAEVANQNPAYFTGAAVFANFGKACGQFNYALADAEKTYYVLNGVIYVGAIDGATNFMVDGKIVTVTAIGNTGWVAHTPVYTQAKDGSVTAVKCNDCGVAGVIVANYASLPAAKQVAGQYFAVPGSTSKVFYWGTAAAVEAPADKVESAQTFDAGIAMYVGMSVMAAAGSAVVLKKKD